MALTKTISADVLSTLQSGKIKNDVYFLPPHRYSRERYEQLAEVINNAGGKWTRKVGGFTFKGTPEAFRRAIEAGETINVQQVTQFFPTPPDVARATSRTRNRKRRKHFRRSSPSNARPLPLPVCAARGGQQFANHENTKRIYHQKPDSRHHRRLCHRSTRNRNLHTCMNTKSTRTKTVRPQACEACPYRKDVPSGVWSANEYAKLVDYDKPLVEQPTAPFACHASPELYCHGWACCHGRSENGSLALMLRGRPELPEPSTELFPSGTEAALHGIRDVAKPTSVARAMMSKLLGKYKRLRDHKETKPKAKRTK